MNYDSGPASGAEFRDKGFAGEATFSMDITQQNSPQIRVGKAERVLFVHY